MTADDYMLGTPEMDDDDYLRGWEAADEAIKHSLPGCKDFSQGYTPWDTGWNYRINQERLKFETKGDSK